jgi:hypothetical protein
MSRGAMGDMLTMNSLGDGSTLSLDFTTMGGVLDPRLTFSRAGGGTYVGADGYIYGVDSATSASLAIGTGSKSVTLTATAGVDRRFQVGQTVYFSSGANNMSGLVTAYNASTQVITINATATTGSGSFTLWFVGNASPRFDYSPTNIGEPRGLLVEGQTVNILKSSEEFSIALGYAEGDLIVPRTSGTSPSGGTAIGFYPTTSSGYHRLTSIYQVGLSGAYTASIWFKRLNSNYRAGINANSLLGAAAIFDLNNAGSLITLSGAATNKAATIIKYPNDWYRVTVTGTIVTETVLFFFMDSSTSTDPNGGSFTGVNGQGMLMWGAQLEAGSGASSYIPTGASQVTRNADQCYLTDFAGWSAGGNFNTAEGTLFVDQAITYVGTTNYPTGGFSTSNTAGSRFGWQYRQGDAPQAYRGLVNAGYIFELPVGAGWTIPSGTTRFRHAMSCGGNTFLRQSLKSSASSGSPTQNNYSDVSTLNISGVAAFTLTQSAFASSVRIAKVKYWPRAFTLNELDSLTT